MKSKHTPAPWVIFNDINGTTIRTLKQKNYYLIANVENTVKDTPCEANARLIASAPELLEACKEMLQCICDYNEGRDSEVNNWIKSWSEVIKNAEKE